MTTIFGILILFCAYVIYQIVVDDPFSGSENVFVRHTGSGDETDIRYQKYPPDTPVPEYSGPAVVADHVDRGTWLHIVLGDKPEFGIKVLILEL